MFDVFDIIGVECTAPMFVLQGLSVSIELIELKHGIVPDNLVGCQIPEPDTDASRFKCNFVGFADVFKTGLEFFTYNNQLLPGTHQRCQICVGAKHARWLVILIPDDQPATAYPDSVAILVTVSDDLVVGVVWVSFMLFKIVQYAG